MLHGLRLIKLISSIKILCMHLPCSSHSALVQQCYKRMYGLTLRSVQLTTVDVNITSVHECLNSLYNIYNSMGTHWHYCIILYPLLYCIFCVLYYTNHMLHSSWAAYCVNCCILYYCVYFCYFYFNYHCKRIIWKWAKLHKSKKITKWMTYMYKVIVCCQIIILCSV